MLLDFAVTNFRCFADEAQLSFVRPSLKTNVPRAGQSWIEVTYRVAGIYGPNASGKSTLVDAVAALSRAVARPGAPLYHPHLLSESGSSQPTRYDVNFTREGVRYHYQVVAHPWGIGQESLHSYPQGSRRHLFTRTQQHEGGEVMLKTGGGLSGPSAEVRKITTSGDLYLAMAHRYEHKTLNPVAKGLANGPAIRLVSHKEADRGARLRWVMSQMLEKPDRWEACVNAIVQMADLGIRHVEVREEEVPQELLEGVRRALNLKAEDEAVELPEELLARLRRSLVFTHAGRGGEAELGLAAQSQGTITWLSSMGPALDALWNGRLLLIDELDASLHPSLTAALVELFQSAEFNQTGAQLLFTSHDTSLLGNTPVRLLEPGEAWFTSKNEYGESELYPLDAFDTRPGNNEQKRYLSGRFGALPRVDLSALRDGAPGDSWKA